MSPRKRAKRNADAKEVGAILPESMPPPLRSRSGSSAASLGPAGEAQTSSTSQGEEPGKANGGQISEKKNGGLKQARSWYGSWPRKSTASTQVALETILGGTTKPSSSADYSRFDTKKNTDAMSMTDGRTTPKLLPEIEENEDKGAKAVLDNNQIKSQDGLKMASTEGRMDTDDTTRKPDSPPAPPSKPSDTLHRPQPSSSWLGWFRATETSPDMAAEPLLEAASTEPDPSSSTVEPAREPPPTSMNTVEGPIEADPARNTGGSWFGFWGTSTTESPRPELSTQQAAGPASATEGPRSENVVMEDEPSAEASSPPPKAGSTWAFWSRDTGSKSSNASKTRSEQGELAVMGENSESHPTKTTSRDLKDSSSIKEAPGTQKSTRKEELARHGHSPKDARAKNKRSRRQSLEADDASQPTAVPGTPKPDTSIRLDSVTKTPKTPKTPQGVTKTCSPNLLLPSFRSTYRLKENPSILRQIAQLLLRTQSPVTNHVFLTQDKPRIRKAIVIGVHGLFPAQFLRPMIGQPTGTSIRFANHCADSIRRWAESHGSNEVEIEKIALEGEGKIGERTENLWRLLLNWIDHIRQADLIMVACHSQGVPVGIMLLAKLIEMGVVTGAKIGVCAMAGVSLGPFPEYRSSMGMLMGSAHELWEFSNFDSEISQRLVVATKAVLRHGVRITYVGSIDDQLVPLESAMYSPAHHPYIYRAVFIDGRLHASDFIAHLVGFAMKLRNLGISDQGLIRELSIPLAGSLYGGEGHSRLYDDVQVYDLAVAHALETTNVGNMPCVIHRHDPLTQPNPYVLPWIMRGLLEQDVVKTDLYEETAELLRQFDDWKPVNKALKDVKYRLEAVRSKL